MNEEEFASQPNPSPSTLTFPDEVAEDRAKVPSLGQLPSAMVSGEQPGLHHMTYQSHRSSNLGAASAHSSSVTYSRRHEISHGGDDPPYMNEFQRGNSMNSAAFQDVELS